MELIDVILSKGNLNRAYKKVVANKGASGVDGVTVEELGDYIRKNKDAIVTSIRNRTYLNKLTKLDLLVIDDFGLMDLDLDKCRDFFEVLDTRDGRKSTVVISQFPVSTWFDMFADNTYADACLTRITDKHHTYRLEMNGINMRETE